MWHGSETTVKLAFPDFINGTPPRKRQIFGEIRTKQRSVLTWQGSMRRSRCLNAFQAEAFSEFLSIPFAVSSAKPPCCDGLDIILALISILQTE